MTNSNKKLSIIIPVYNVEKFISRCLDSCLNQDIDKDEYEIIVVNDGSPDGSLDIILEYAKIHDNIKIVNRDNGGLSAARNEGLKYATGEYLFFVDSDDWIAQNCLSKLLDILSKEKPEILIISAATVCDDRIKRYTPIYDFDILSGPEAFAKFLSPCAPFSIVSRLFFSENNFKFYEGIFHEDSELIHRVHYSAKKICFTNEIIYYYFVNSNSIMGRVNYKRSYDLINVVCPQLDSFCRNYVANNHKRYFSYAISVYINNALSYINSASVNEKQKFNEMLEERKNLLYHLWNSNVIKYKFEYLLFIYISNDYLKVYKYLYRILHFKFFK